MMKSDVGGVRTRAPGEIAALTQRLGPLGHDTRLHVSEKFYTEIDFQRGGWWRPQGSMLRVSKIESIPWPNGRSW